MNGRWTPIDGETQLTEKKDDESCETENGGFRTVLPQVTKTFQITFISLQICSLQPNYKVHYHSIIITIKDVSEIDNQNDNFCFSRT